ncbi:hypothetical protein BS78_09G110400 [Paspalum vaginatum]|nr:hypothetical protein BS78_09G110400 [Paspalum vaginatum]
MVSSLERMLLDTRTYSLLSKNFWSNSLLCWLNLYLLQICFQCSFVIGHRSLTVYDFQETLLCAAEKFFSILLSGNLDFITEYPIARKKNNRVSKQKGERGDMMTLT